MAFTEKCVEIISLILILLRLTVAASSADAAVRRKCLDWIQEH